MKARYDVVVVGGGPAGSWAAKCVVEKGVSVLLLEKDREIGIPVRCAEGVSEKGLRTFIPEFSQEWISRTIIGVRLVAPDGRKVDAYTGERGFILDRKRFDYDLAKMAVEKGAEIMTNAYVSGLIVENGFVKGVNGEHFGKSFTVHASIVMGADGVESRVGRWAGLKTQCPLQDIETCVQATLAGLEKPEYTFDPDIVELHFGHEVAPGGYAWVFPKSSGSANVGLGISGEYARFKKPIEYLKRFIDRRFPNASVLTWVAGSVPVGPIFGDIVTNGLMLVGDAAHQATPITGGGIFNAIQAAGIAGEVAGEAIYSGDVSKKKLVAYQKAWMKSEGKINERFYKIKNVLFKLSDEELNHIADTLLKIPTEERNVHNIIKAGLFRHPKLILELAKTWW